VFAGVQPRLAGREGSRSGSLVRRALAAVVAMLAAFHAVLSLGAERPLVALIIDDLGNRPALDRRVLALPGEITCAFLPGTPYAGQLAELADALGKEVMLHLPMEPLAVDVDHTDMLNLDMSREAFGELVRSSLAALPQARGVNNHMGSLLTQSPLRMQWLMEELLAQQHGLYFVDSYTSVRSVAWQVATANHLPNARRDVFLDASRDPAAIALQFRRLLRLAHQHGHAVAIAHPYPETVEFLERHLSELDAEGVALVSVSRLIRSREERKAKAILVDGESGGANVLRAVGSPHTGIR
jgi:polysaccharide deacetylase 2 family uncharacterized protein YibQ